jgi:hypothetical protein
MIKPQLVEADALAVGQYITPKELVPLFHR